MAAFTCRIGTQSGKVLVEDRESESASRLRQQLESEGYYVFQVRPRGRFGSLSFSRPTSWRRVQKKWADGVRADGVKSALDSALE